MVSPNSRRPLLWSIALISIIAFCRPLTAQDCNLTLGPVGGGRTLASPFGATDPELDVSVSPDEIVLENRRLRVVYGSFFEQYEQFGILEFRIKSAGEENQVREYFDADSGRGSLIDISVLVDNDQEKRVRIRWNPAEGGCGGAPLVQEVSLFANAPYLKIDYLNARGGINIVDRGNPGGTLEGVHVVHGSEDWIRGLDITFDNPFAFGSYYNRFPADGVLDPTDGGSLNYNDHFVLGVYNPANGRGFGRTIPIEACSILKLLFDETLRRGFELFPYPYCLSHSTYTSYLYAVEGGGASEILDTGRQLVDGTFNPMSPTYLCGTGVDIEAIPYSGWDFDSWSNDASGNANPLNFDLSADSQVTGNFVMEPNDYSERFNTYLPGDDPSNWLDTGQAYSLNPTDRFEVLADSDDLYFGTFSVETNIHSHYTGLGSSLWNGYQFRGRLRIDDPTGGIGLTFFSQFPSGTSYYRIRRYFDLPFRLEQNDTQATGGRTDSGIIPVPNVWYRFLVEVADTGSATEIRAKFWPDGGLEPSEWQIDAFDDSPTRLTQGTIGVWTFWRGGKQFDDFQVSLFEPVATEYPINVAINGEGSVVRTPDQAVYTLGEEVTLEAIADPGYVFVGWSGALSGSDNPETLTITRELSVTAIFEEIESQSLDLVTAGTGSGSVEVTPDLPEYLTGTEVTLTATADPGSIFTGWSGDADGFANPLVLTINSDTTVVANFSSGDFAISENFEAFAPGSDPENWLDTGPDNLVEEPDRFEVEQIAGERFFTTFSTATNLHSHYTGPGSAVLTNYIYRGRMRMTDAAAGIGVTFLSDYPNTDSYYRLRRYFDRSFRISPRATAITGGDIDSDFIPAAAEWVRFEIRCEDTGTRTEIRAKVWPEASPEPNDYSIDCYDDSPTRLTQGTIGVWSFWNGRKDWDDLSVELLGDPPTDLLLTTNTAGTGSGTVSVDPDQATYDFGASVTLEAIPGSGSIFTGWTGDFETEENPLAIVLLGDRQVTANFTEVTTHTVTTASDGSGAVVRVPDLAEYILGSTVILTAVPDPGFVFVGWSGDAAGLEPQIELNVDGDIDATALFLPETEAYAQGFASFAPGSQPTDWIDTGAGNALTESDALFSVIQESGVRFFSTSSTAANIHSHYNGPFAISLADYDFTGRMRMTDAAGGIGVTFLSDYPNTDRYYRLRRYFDRSFRISPHGTEVTGQIDSGVIPQAGVWYRFRVQVEALAGQTEIRAKVWVDGEAEPAAWQIDCTDNSPTRLTAGNVGVWSFWNGRKDWDDFLVVPLP